MSVTPYIFQDRTPVSALELSHPALAAELSRSRLGKTADKSSVHFCGLAWVRHDTAFVFVPRQSLADDVCANQDTARLTMHTLARYGRDMSERIGIATGGEGNTGLLAIIAELAQDFLQHGIFSERVLRSTRNSGKPHWPATLAREAVFVDAHNNMVYPSVRTTRFQDSHSSLLARVQASVLLEIATRHGWWIDGLTGREAELKQYDPPGLPRHVWATHLNLLLRDLYATRAITLTRALISYLLNDRNRDSGEIHFGVEDFHVVWEHMLRQVLTGVEAGWNSRLPRPVYERSDGQFDVQTRGLQTDIVLRDSLGLRVVDAKYYDATTITNSPGVPDILKQFFYDMALTSVAGDEAVTGCFVFPAGSGESGVYERVTMRHRDGRPVTTLPHIDCHYLCVTQVMRAFVNNEKITLKR